MPIKTGHIAEVVRELEHSHKVAPQAAPAAFDRAGLPEFIGALFGGGPFPASLDRLAAVRPGILELELANGPPPVPWTLQEERRTAG